MGAVTSRATAGIALLAAAIVASPAGAEPVVSNSEPARVAATGPMVAPVKRVAPVTPRVPLASHSVAGKPRMTLSAKNTAAQTPEQTKSAKRKH